MIKWVHLFDLEDTMRYRYRRPPVKSECVCGHEVTGKRVLINHGEIEEIHFKCKKCLYSWDEMGGL